MKNTDERQKALYRPLKIREIIALQKLILVARENEAYATGGSLLYAHIRFAALAELN